MIKIKRGNRTGCIYKVKEKRRKQWRVYITNGWDDNGKQIRKSLGYYPTYDDAVIGLNEYIKTPYDLDYNNVTFESMWNEVMKDLNKLVKDKKMTEKNVYCLSLAFKNHLTSIHKTKLSDIRYITLQNIIDESDLGRTGRGFIKTVCQKIFERAITVHELPLKDPTLKLKVNASGNSDKHIPFTDEELNVLWNNVNDDFVKTILIFCYTGMRPNELFSINRENIHIEERYMVGGSKTEAGRDRVIPIHKKILPLIEHFFYNGSNEPFKQLIEDFNYGKYWRVINKLMKDFNMNHTAYDGRHTFITRMKQAGANEQILKKIIGHSIQDLTERVYTHRSIKELVNEVDKLD